MFYFDRWAAFSAFACITMMSVGCEAALAQNHDAICVLVDSQGNTLDLSRLCGEHAEVPRKIVAKPVKARPASLPVPKAGEVPDYGVIFLNPMGDEPIHLEGRYHYLKTSLGNASSGPVEDIWLSFEIFVSIEGEYASIGQGSKQVRQATLGAGDRVAVNLSVADVMENVITPFQRTEDLSIRVTSLYWTEADGSRNSFSPDSYRLAKGVGRCHFPWELDWSKRACGARAISNRL